MDYRRGQYGSQESFDFRDDGDSRRQRGRSAHRDDDYEFSNGRDYDPPRRDRSSSRNRESNMVYRGQKPKSRPEESRGAGKPGPGTLKSMDSIQDPGKRYVLKDVIGTGVCGTVYSAVDTQAGNKKVAVKIQDLTPDTQQLIVEEYRVLRDFCGHSNLPDFYGIYRKRASRKGDYDQIWLIMELCEGGPVMDLVRGLGVSEKKIQEEQIAYVLKEIVKALSYLHENRVIHRDVRGDNILLSKEGEVKLVDFGFSRMFKGEAGKRNTTIGSPCWMAPEVVTSRGDPDGGYTARSDVWSLGITAIELADGKAPFQDMHPTRVLFQIVRNPPPGLHRPVNWSENFNDFISECLEKNPENRPVMAEMLMHPFLAELPENDYHLTQELKALSMGVRERKPVPRPPEVMVRNGFLKRDQERPAEAMLHEDLAALETLTEDTILDELHERLRRGHFQTFVGDILVILNPNEIQDIYGNDYHEKYNFKSRSENSPHIYSVADSAYQDVLHHEEPQHVLFAGESNSGKTTNALHLIKHLMYLGKSATDIGVRVFKAIDLIHSFSHAATPLNTNSTRCVLQIQTTFGSTGKASGAIFWLYQLEKWRVSTKDTNKSNFHVFYYLYDGIEAKGRLKKYNLPRGRRMRYLRMNDSSSRNRSFKVRNDPQGNSLKFDEIEETLRLMEMDEHTDFIWTTLSAILLLGEVSFTEGNNGEAEVENRDLAYTVAEHLGTDPKKFVWCLTNYCILKKGAAVRRKHTCEEAKEARDVLANTLYQRLVDWIINSINIKLAMTRTLFGDKYVVSVLDMFGFECFSANRFEQLIVNTMNEQLQCYYNQRVFAWEMQEQEEENIPVQHFHYYDNREAIEQLMGKNSGLFLLIDHASRQQQDTQYIIEKVKRHARSVHVKAVSYHEFTVAHYTGKITYDAAEIVEKNRDFIPPEMINAMRLSSHDVIKQLFTNQLTKSGNLTVVVEGPRTAQKRVKPKRELLGLPEPSRLRRFNTASRGQFSQTRKMRTCAAIFKSTSLEILKNLSIGGGSGGTHFVRCIRADLEAKPRGFHREIVRQQIRALALLDTAKARQKGYPHRVPFQEFLRRYQFLAFDFDENVEITRDNCRLLLVRLKMEGWVVGKTKVFLKYYNEEYLARLYEIQVRKIIKIQAMLRSFLARKKANRVANKKKGNEKAKLQKKQSISHMSQDEAATKIQARFRGHQTRKGTGPLLKGDFDVDTKDFMAYYFRKWRTKSVFQVLLRYRAVRYQDLVQLSQQVHLFNQALNSAMHKSNLKVPSGRIDPNVTVDSFLEKRMPQVHKLPFDLSQEFPMFDTTYMNEPSTSRRPRGNSPCSSLSDEDMHENWDAPLRRQTVPWFTSASKRDVEVQTTNSPHRSPRGPVNSGQSIINTPYSRDPRVPVQLPPEVAPPKVNPTVSRGNFMGPTGPTAGSYLSRSNNYNKNNNDSVRSKKKNPPPPIPQMQNRNWGDHEGTSRRGSANELDFDRNRNMAGTNRANPINELKSIGRRNSNNNDFDEEPPFNFQAMLRKTPHQRESMKRTPIYDSYRPPPPSYDPPSLPKPSKQVRENEFSYKASTDPDAVTVYRSGSNVESPEWSPNEMVRMSEKYGREGAWGGDQPEDKAAEGASGMESGKKPQRIDAPTTVIGPDGLSRVEIAPGIIVEGYCKDF
ncbi:neither inactivation nor afterpotential protein C [Diachasma alloeum]|uniref:neither inactivation nor afterpotential protein C n=1 Tax=Diachasma alloeum TaxID=454923 RepID=UPI000738281D|nr:neither inactivation nor afterpotential protein C [Diachasma alloeum]